MSGFRSRVGFVEERVRGRADERRRRQVERPNRLPAVDVVLELIVVDLDQPVVVAIPNFQRPAGAFEHESGC